MKKHSLKFWIIFWVISIIFLFGFYFVLQFRKGGMEQVIDYLPIGQEKCTERAHNGADAKFDYTVYHSDENEPRQETFYSHYIPWQEVCLLGVTEEELLAEQASSTPEDL